MAYSGSVNGLSYDPLYEDEAKELLLPGGYKTDFKSRKPHGQGGRCCCYVCPNICCNRRRNVVITIAIVALFAFVGLGCVGLGTFYGAKSYIQSVADSSDIQLGKMTFEGINGTDTHMLMSAETHLVAETLAAADFKDIMISMSRSRSAKPFGHLEANSTIHLVPYKDNLAVIGGKAEILNLDEFTKFSYDLFQGGKGEDGVPLVMTMDVTVQVAGMLSFKHISVEREIMISGFNNFNGSRCTGISAAFKNNNPDDVLVDLTTCTENPSNVSIRNMGYASMELYSRGTHVATETTTTDVNIEHGTFCQRALGPAVVAAAPEIASVFQNYLNGRYVPISMKHMSTSNLLFNGFMQEVHQSVTADPFGKNLVNYALMDLPKGFTEIRRLLFRALTKGSLVRSSTIYISNPFEVPMTLYPEFKLVSSGMQIGTTDPMTVHLPGGAYRYPVNATMNLKVQQSDLFQLAKILSEIMADNHSVLDGNGQFGFAIGSFINGSLSYNQTIVVCNRHFKKTCEDLTA